MKRFCNFDDRPHPRRLRFEKIRSSDSNQLRACLLELSQTISRLISVLDGLEAESGRLQREANEQSVSAAPKAADPHDSRTTLWDYGTISDENN